MTKRISLAETAHNVVRNHLSEGNSAIDATLGNGHDTVFLAQCVGISGQVYGFDVQSPALAATRQRLQQHGLLDRATLFLASHADMLDCIPISQHKRIQAVMFNLGYLTGSDKSVITRLEGTLAALDAACAILADRGLITVIAYPGHSGGNEETVGIERWLQSLTPKRYEYRTIFSTHHQLKAPRIFVIQKLG